MIEDKLLIWKFKLGDRDALRRIYEKYKNNLLKLAIVLLKDVNNAEDAVEEVFTGFARSAEKIGISGNLKTYLSTCLVNRIRNSIRDRKRHETTGTEEAENIISESKNPEQWAILNEELEILSRAMAQLPYEQREVISLYMQGDMTFKQIAKFQDISINTAQGRYRYGFEKLRSVLNSEMSK
jgi:RNA polymerase sigma factor (sigma-70 family)